MIANEVVDATLENLTRYEAKINECLVGKPMALGGVTAFTCIRMCFGELHTVDHKFETVAGVVTNGEYNFILEELQWQFIEYDQVLLHDKMDAKEVEVLLSFVTGRIVKSVSLQKDSLVIQFDGNTKLITKIKTYEEAEADGIFWYFSKGEEWLVTYNLDKKLETSLLAS